MKIKIYSHNLKVTISEIEYEWSGTYGAILISKERGVKKNDIRMIGNVIFYARDVSRIGWDREVFWVPQEDVDINWIREFKKAVFGIENED